jgi:catalase
MEARSHSLRGDPVGQAGTSSLRSNNGQSEIERLCNRRSLISVRTNHDYYSQPGNLFRMFSSREKQRLFENTPRSLGPASKEVRDRHVANCSMADPAYGEGVAKALEHFLAEHK